VRGVSLLSIALALLSFAAPARADIGPVPTLLETIESAELIVIGSVASRSGDPSTFGCQREVLGVESVLAGECPEGALLLQSSSSLTLDTVTGLPVRLELCGWGESWTHGERVLAFLQRVPGVEGWFGSQVHRVAPGDLDLYAEKVAQAVELLALPHSVEKRAALRAWAVSLFDHAATLRAGIEMLWRSTRVRTGTSSLGRLDEDQEARLVRAAELCFQFGGTGFEPLDWQLAQLTQFLPSRSIDVSLATRVDAANTGASGRAAYATLLAGRRDDSELRMRALDLEQLADCPDAWTDDPERRGAWTIRFEARCEAFTRSARELLNGLRRD